MHFWVFALQECLMLLTDYWNRQKNKSKSSCYACKKIAEVSVRQRKYSIHLGNYLSKCHVWSQIS